jgi:hydrogenase nickel incorporation protein HypA/HybF
MHELAICQALMSQVETIARENRAVEVTSITLGMGQLSGVEERLLKHAYPVASAGTVAEDAELIISSTPVRVKCEACGKESEAAPNRLLCGYCENWRTQVISGDELLLLQVELVKQEDSESTEATQTDDGLQ